jgi:hypothetical protein
MLRLGLLVTRATTGRSGAAIEVTARQVGQGIGVTWRPQEFPGRRTFVAVIIASHRRCRARLGTSAMIRGPPSAAGSGAG